VIEEAFLLLDRCITRLGMHFDTSLIAHLKLGGGERHSASTGLRDPKPRIRTSGD